MTTGSGELDGEIQKSRVGAEHVNERPHIAFGAGHCGVDPLTRNKDRALDCARCAELSQISLKGGRVVDRDELVKGRNKVCWL